MKYLLSTIFLLLSLTSVISQVNEFNNVHINDIIIGVIVDDQAEPINSRIKILFENKLLNALSFNGISSPNSNYSYIMYPVISIIDKEITSSPPYYYSMIFSVTLYVSNYDKSTTFGNYTFLLKGIGKSEIQAYQNALKEFNPRQKKLQIFISNIKQKISKYIFNNCDLIIENAITIANSGDFAKINIINYSNTNYDEIMVDGKRKALSILSSIDKNNEKCYLKALKEMNKIYNILKIESCDNFMIKAKSYIVTKNYDKALNCILSVPYSSSCEKEIDELLNKIERKKELEDRVKNTLKIYKTNIDSLNTDEVIELYKVLGSSYNQYLLDTNE